MAAIFHDIAKVVAVTIAELGAEDAIEFCRTHGFTERRMANGGMADSTT